MEFKARRKKLAALYFSVEEVYDQTPDLESAGKRIAWDRLHPFPPFLKTIPASSCRWCRSRPILFSTNCKKMKYYGDTPPSGSSVPNFFASGYQYPAARLLQKLCILKEMVNFIFRN